MTTRSKTYTPVLKGEGLIRLVVIISGIERFWGNPMVLEKLLKQNLFFLQSDL